MVRGLKTNTRVEEQKVIAAAQTHYIQRFDTGTRAKERDRQLTGERAHSHRSDQTTEPASVHRNRIILDAKSLE